MKELIEDYKYFLDHIYTLSKPLSKAQRNSLETLLKSQLTMLVMLKKGSNLGNVSWTAVTDLLNESK